MSKRLIKSVPELDIKSLLDKEKIATEVFKTADTLKSDRRNLDIFFIPA